MRGGQTAWWWSVLACLACASGCVDHPEPAARAALTPRAGELLLDARADGAALFGRPLPVVANADPARLLALRLEGARFERRRVEAEPVLDARFVGEAIALLTRDHRLVLLREGGAPRAQLDVAVEAPLSVLGERIAYTRGEAPFFEVAIADTRTGAVRAVTDGLAPTWNPALAPDGSVYFVSGATGGPKLLRAAPSGAVSELPTTRFPASAVAPRVIDGALVFEDPAGPVSIELSTSPLRGVPGRATSPLGEGAP